tara:strand:+ start:341 stop:829 length:489 start_codon:yes stop_codon:yes gene_type:complete
VFEPFEVKTINKQPNKETMNTPTPRTDAVATSLRGDEIEHEHAKRFCSLARQLERELNEAKAKAKESRAVDRLVKSGNEQERLRSETAKLEIELNEVKGHFDTYVKAAQEAREIDRADYADLRAQLAAKDEALRWIEEAARHRPGAYQSVLDAIAAKAKEVL